MSTIEKAERELGKAQERLAAVVAAEANAERAEAAERLARIGWDLVPGCLSASKPGAPQKWGHSLNHLIRECEGWQAYQDGKKGAASS